ncbi:MAG: rhodanese-like domain-containing protein [Cocleimonas sp.]
MNKKLVLIILSTMMLALSACNSNPASSVDKTTTTTAAAEPIPQAGGYSNIDNAKLAEFIKSGMTVIDIRRKEEWQQTGIIKGSKTITFFDNTGRINPDFVPEFTAITNPEKAVVLICRTGNRTQAASQAIAQQLGYKTVYNVTHGITGWIAEKRTVEKY